MISKDTLITDLRREDLMTCARIIDETPLFQEYGASGQGVANLLEKAMGDPASDLIAARSAETLSGFAWVLKKGAFGRSAYLRLIATSTQFRSQGIGHLLLTHVEEKHAKPHGLFLLTSEHNEGARAFYERAGYSRIGVIPGYVKAGINECIYFKR